MMSASDHKSTYVASHTCAVCSLLIFFLFSFIISFGQDSTKSYIPFNYEPAHDKKKETIVAVSEAAAYGAGLLALNSTWYKDYPRSSFHFFNDGPEWMQMDKLGHVYSAYAVGKTGMELWRWTGVSRKKRIWLGGLSGAAYQTIIEILDGFSTQWGWSWTDFGANTLGSAMLISQELLWDDQKIQMKWSFHKKKYAESDLEKRSDFLFGKSIPERMLKDYNGQTYWLSSRIKNILPSSNIPDWLQISFGTGVEGVYGARSNVATIADGSGFNRSDIERRRQWYIAPDVDLTRIKTRKKGIRMALNMLSVIKFPAPALEYSGGKFRFHPVYF